MTIPMDERDGPTLEEIKEAAERDRARPSPCPACGRIPPRDEGIPTERELRAFRAYLAAGSVKQAAADLGLQVQTVKNILSGLYHRVGCENAAQAAYRLGQGEWGQESTTWTSI